MKKVLITGATGFVGAVLCERLITEGYAVRAAVRTLPTTAPKSKAAATIAAGGIDSATDWRDALRNVDAVVHLAARVHVMHETRADPLAEFRRTNLEGTERLARQAAEAGVKRLIYVSSIKVNGETSGEQPFTAEDAPTPEDPYALSKWEAEQALRDISEKTRLEVVIVRPPLVYGPRVKGNFLRLLNLIDSATPLPLGALNNRRSLVGIDNLCDLLRVCIEHPAAANQIFLVSDGEDLSTRDLVLRLADAMNRPLRLLPVPSALLCLAGIVAGKSAEVKRLCDTLQVDMTKTERALGWRPPCSVADGLQGTVDWYLSQRREPEVGDQHR
jgi:UDP-N-acetyl-alpha-D-quinovosamine dehydrogenase